MGVYIKGMEMPDSCWNCPVDKPLCTLWQGMTVDEMDNGRHKDCPLVPILPHGRLVDADVMQKGWFNLNFDRKITDGTLAYWNFQLSKIPTIIEAEEEE